jgi:hypothetical protein
MSHLNSIRVGIGTAHRYAVDHAINAPKEPAENSVKQAELDRKMSRRYVEALDAVHENDPRFPFRNRGPGLSNAKHTVVHLIAGRYLIAGTPQI